MIDYQHIGLDIIGINVKIKFRTFDEKSFMSNQDFVEAQILSEEILRIKALTRKQFNIPCSKCYV